MRTCRIGAPVGGVKVVMRRTRIGFVRSTARAAALRLQVSVTCRDAAMERCVVQAITRRVPRVPRVPTWRRTPLPVTRTVVEMTVGPVTRVRTIVACAAGVTAGVSEGKIGAEAADGSDVAKPSAAVAVKV